MFSAGARVCSPSREQVLALMYEKLVDVARHSPDSISVRPGAFPSPSIWMEWGNDWARSRATARKAMPCRVAMPHNVEPAIVGETLVLRELEKNGHLSNDASGIGLHVRELCNIAANAMRFGMHPARHTLYGFVAHADNLPTDAESILACMVAAEIGAELKCQCTANVQIVAHPGGQFSKLACVLGVDAKSADVNAALFKVMSATVGNLRFMAWFARIGRERHPPMRQARKKRGAATVSEMIVKASRGVGRVAASADMLLRAQMFEIARTIDALEP